MQGKKTTMTLLNVAYAPKYDSNLISLRQLHKSGIWYYDYPNSIILRKEGSILRIASRYKNFFVLETSLKIILVQGKGRLTYFLSSKVQICLWHRRLDYASNARVIQASKLADRIDLGGEISSDDRAHSFDSESNKKDAENKPAPINKAIDSLEITEQLCKAYVESKHTRIVKSKGMTPTTKKLQEVHIDL